MPYSRLPSKVTPGDRNINAAEFNALVDAVRVLQNIRGGPGINVTYGMSGVSISSRRGRRGAPKALEIPFMRVRRFALSDPPGGGDPVAFALWCFPVNAWGDPNGNYIVEATGELPNTVEEGLILVYPFRWPPIVAAPYDMMLSLPGMIFSEEFSSDVPTFVGPAYNPNADPEPAIESRTFALLTFVGVCIP